MGGKYITIKPGDGAELKSDVTGDIPGLAFLQRCVGGSIEHVYPTRLPEGVDLFCNEDGKNDGLSHNLVASLLYKSDFDYLVGPVVIVAHDDEGESHWLSDEQATEIMNQISGMPETEEE